MVFKRPSCHTDGEVLLSPPITLGEHIEREYGQTQTTFAAKDGGRMR